MTTNKQASNNLFTVAEQETCMGMWGTSKKYYAFFCIILEKKYTSTLPLYTDNLEKYSLYQGVRRPFSSLMP